MGKQWKQWETLFWGAPKSLWMVTVAMKLKDTWKESCDQLRQCIQKPRHHFADKGPYTKNMVIPVVMYWWNSWTIKLTEYQRNDCFELWFWRRLLKVPWTAGRSNWSILKDISPEYSSEGLMLWPILWPTDAKSWFIGNDPVSGKDWG